MQGDHTMITRRWRFRARVVAGAAGVPVLVLVVASAAATVRGDDAASGPPTPVRVPRLIALVGVDTPGDPAAPSAGVDSPTRSSGPFDSLRSDLGEDDDLQRSGRRRRRSPADAARAAEQLPDPLAGTQRIDPAATGQDAMAVLARMLPDRTDTWADWSAGLEPLHFCGEPRALPPCVPPPPCHPSLPPAPYDLVGVLGDPSCGPIYRGPCGPRTGTHDQGPHPHLHRVCDRLFDAFYMWK